MSSWLRCFALAAFVTLSLVPPVRASNDPGSHPSTTLLVSNGTSAFQPVVVPSSALQPVRLVSVPVYPTVNSALVSTSLEPVGKISPTCAPADSNRHLTWTIYGAIAGFAVGLINGHDEGRDALIGAGVGLIASFVVTRY